MTTRDQTRIDAARDHASARAELLLAIEFIEDPEVPEDRKAEGALALVPAMREYLGGEKALGSCATCGQPLGDIVP